MRRTISIITSLGLFIWSAANAATIMPWDPSLAKPFAYKDPRTSITIYVESDGRHVAAIDAEGRLLWIRSPIKESGFDGPESQTPVIDGIKVAEPPPPQYVKWLRQRGFKSDHAHMRITFADRSFGLIDEKTGDFILEGQN